MLTLTLLWLVLAGTAVCLDRTQAVQLMVSRPVVIGPLFGFWAGEPMLGAAVGVALEFLYAGRLPVGSHVPPSDTLAAVGAAGLLVAVPELRTLGGAGLATAVALPLAELGRDVDILVRKANGRIAGRVDDMLREGDLTHIEKAPWLALLFAAGVYAAVLALFFVVAGTLLARVTLSGWLATAFGFFLAGLPLLGLAESSATLDLRRFPRAAVLGLMVGMGLLVVFA